MLEIFPLAESLCPSFVFLGDRTPGVCHPRVERLMTC